MNLEENISACKETRKWVAEAICSILKNNASISEKDFCEKLSRNFFENKKIHENGWYLPPPGGVSTLFDSSTIPERLSYDTLRKEENWPKDEYIFKDNSVGMIYASPVSRNACIIGDFGMTVYNGTNEKLKKHIRKTLDLTQKITNFAQVGMEFREIHAFAQKLFQEHGVNNNRTFSQNDPRGTNIGHTIPWTHELATQEECAILEQDDMLTRNDLISKKRVFVNGGEKFKVPHTIAFTIEQRLEDSEDPTVPNTVYHTIVSFVGGKKEISTNFENIFRVLNMDYMLNN